VIGGDGIVCLRDGVIVGHIFLRWEERYPGSWWVRYRYHARDGSKSEELSTLSAIMRLVDGKRDKALAFGDMFAGEDDDEQEEYQGQEACF
jgi:hypothetical protein